MTFSGRVAAFCAGFVITVGCVTAPAHAQSGPPFDPTAASPSSALIESWVDTQAKDIAGGDRDKVVAARQALIITSTPVERMSPKFVEVYGKAVADKLMAIASSPDAHARLNAAMVVGKVAEMGATTEIIPLTVKLLGDESPAVVIYGIRASSHILPRVLGNKSAVGGDKIMPAIMAAVKKHPKSEAVIGEAFQAPIRVLSNNAAAAALPPGTILAATPPTIEALLELLTERISHYGNGSVVDPGAEGPAIGFLARTSSWAAMNPQTQTRTIKTILGIANGAASELTIEAKATNRPRLVAIQNLLKSQISQSLNVIGNQAKRPDLVTQADKLKNFTSLTVAPQWIQAVSEITVAFSEAFKIESPTTPTNKADAASQPSN